MVVETVLKTSPGTLKNYLEEYTGIMMIKMDKNLNIEDCNRGFLDFYGFKDKPVNTSIFDYINQNSSDEIIYPVSSSEPVNLKLSIQGKSREESVSTYIVNCYFFFTGEKYLMFWEQRILIQSEIVEKMSVLNEELTNLTRELNKKNAELKKANDTITRLLRIDPLTEIYNRRFLIEEMTKAFSIIKRRKTPYSLVMADLDRFKAVNDTWGHGFGDKVLVNFSKLLLRESREEDIPARIGGEEFVVLLPTTGLQGGKEFAERVRKAFKNLEIPPLKEPLTCSLGVTQLREDDEVDAVMQRADNALYLAKEKGRDKVVVYN